MRQAVVPQARQRGMTFFGGLILIGFIGVFVYALIRLTPLYVERLNVSRDLHGLASVADSLSSEGQVREALNRRFQVDEVKSVSAAEAVITRQGMSFAVHLAYTAETPFIDPVGLTVRFDDTVVLSRASGP